MNRSGFLKWTWKYDLVVEGIAPTIYGFRSDGLLVDFFHGEACDMFGDSDRVVCESSFW